MKNSCSAHISTQNIDCRYLLEPPCRCGSNEFQQSMFLSRNKKINVHPCKPQFFLYKNAVSLRKHAYSNLLKILLPKYENFQIKISDIFHISAQNIDCGYSLEPPRRGGSNESPQPMF